MNVLHTVWKSHSDFIVGTRVVRNCGPSGDSVTEYVICGFDNIAPALQLAAYLNGNTTAITKDMNEFLRVNRGRA